MSHRLLFFHQNKAITKSVRFYNSCIDEAAVEKEGLAPMKKLIDDMGGWHVTNSTPVTRPLLDRIAKMNQLIPKVPLFHINVFIHPTNSNKHIVLVSIK